MDLFMILLHVLDTPIKEIASQQGIWTLVSWILMKKKTYMEITINLTINNSNLILVLNYTVIQSINQLDLSQACINKPWLNNQTFSFNIVFLTPNIQLLNR